jgi:hypothetical protein
MTLAFDSTTQRIIEAKFSKEAKNKQEYVATLRDVANQSIAKEQWDQALDKIEGARAVIFELQQVIFFVSLPSSVLPFSLASILFLTIPPSRLHRSHTQKLAPSQTSHRPTLQPSKKPSNPSSKENSRKMRTTRWNGRGHLCASRRSSRAWIIGTKPQKNSRKDAK